MNLDILAIASHPDDVELCCAGTLAKAVKSGSKVGILDLTKGELGTRGTEIIRSREALAAAKILGCLRENLHLPDGNIQVTERNKLRLIQVYRRYQPRIILIPHFFERHPDHVNTHRLAREAWFYSGLRKIETKFNGKKEKPWRPDNYFHYMQWFEFFLSFIVNITAVYPKRVAATKAKNAQFNVPASKDPQTLL